LHEPIDEPGHRAGHLVIPVEEEALMLKTIAAALLAVSVLAAPAMAAGTSRAPVIKTAQVKHSVLNANAKMARHHHKSSRHHQAHKRTAAHKSHRFSKVTTKHSTSAAKRG
jgi:Ni/Co efflux regulator RcnB